MKNEPEIRQFIAFKLGDEEFAFDISTVREIFPPQSITKVHRSPEYIEGVMNLRGRLVTVIDMRKRFRLQPTVPSENSKIIVVDSPDAPVGFLVDEVTEVTRLSTDTIEPVPAYVAEGIESEYVLGIAKLDSRLLTLIDPLKVLQLSSDDGGAAGGEPGGNGVGR